MFTSLLQAAEWEEHGVKVLKTEPSLKEGVLKRTLQDEKGKTFEVHHPDFPEKPRRERTLALKDLFFGWKHISVRDLEFYYDRDHIYANMHTKKIFWQGENLRPYLPAGLAFQDASDGLYFRFRIVVKDTSYKLDGKYTDEETLLREIYSFIRAVEEGKMSDTELIKYRFDDNRVIVPKKEPIKPRWALSGGLNYLLPTGAFGKAFGSGYGGLVTVALNNTGVSLNDKTLFHLDFSLSTGFWWFNRKSQDDNGSVTGDVDCAYMVPLIFNVRYPIPVYRGLFAAPSLGVGYNYNSLGYHRNTPENTTVSTKVNKWAPSVSAGVQLDLPVYKDKVILLGGADYFVLLEREMNCTTFVFSLGAGYLF